MKNKYKIINLIISLIIFSCCHASSNDQFNFNVTEVEITENGNKIKGNISFYFIKKNKYWLN